MTTNHTGDLHDDSCREAYRAGYDAYYSTVHVSVGLKDMFGDDGPCTLKVNEPKMARASSAPVCPDAIFQCDGDSKGIVCEIKSSIPDDDGLAIRDIGDQIDKYSEIETGWRTEDGRIAEHSILLLVNRDDVKRLRRLLAGRRRPAAGARPGVKICLADWEQTVAPQPDAEEIILVRHHWGSTGCQYVDERLENNIRISLDATIDRYENRKFVKADPPPLYMIVMLYHDIFPTIAVDGGDIEVSLEGLTDKLTQYYASWSGIENEQSQIRPRWVRRALDMLCKIGLAKELQGDSRYRIKPALHQKDLMKFIIGRLCDASAGGSQSRMEDFG